MDDRGEEERKREIRRRGNPGGGGGGGRSHEDMGKRGFLGRLKLLFFITWGSVKGSRSRQICGFLL